MSQNKTSPWYDINGDCFSCCPVNFIPNSVWEFIDEYLYTKKFPCTAKPYLQLTNKFLDGISIYENALIEFQKIKIPRG